MTLSTRREAFRVDNVARGLDHQRTQYVVAFGDYVANSSTTFRAGMMVDLNSSGEIIRSLGATPLGWSKYNKSTTSYGSVIGEYIQLNGLVATSLKHANLWNDTTDQGVCVSVARNGTPLVEDGAGDYTVSYTNGTITRLVTSTIADGGYVYVNYQWELTAAEKELEGHNFWNYDDDVTVQGGKVTVITGADAIIYTTSFDPSVQYAINTKVRCGTTAIAKEGVLTTAGSGAYVGYVVQVPTAADPFLGIRSILL